MERNLYSGVGPALVADGKMIARDGSVMGSTRCVVDARIAELSGPNFDISKELRPFTECAIHAGADRVDWSGFTRVEGHDFSAIA